MSDLDLISLFSTNGILLLLIIVLGVAVVAVRSLLASAMLYGIYSLLMALIWVNLYAMDVAFTEAAVGAGISTTLVLEALASTGADSKPSRLIHWPGLIVVSTTGAALIYGVLDMPNFGDPDARVHHHVAPEYISQTVGKLGADATGNDHGDFGEHVPNLVTAVLASYRAYDTMFETVVIFTAGVCLVLLFDARREHDSRCGPGGGSSLMREKPVLRVAVKHLIPGVVLFGCYVVAHGELGPGGGFQGGVIIAAAFIMYCLIFGLEEGRRVLPSRVVDFLAALGVMIFAGVGALGLLRSSKFLDYSVLNPGSPAVAESWGIALVEYGVGITVAAAFITIFNKVADRGRR